ncbi:MAG TPA: helix-turn-helix domain-containing protein [Galbitalea sp.]
MPFKSLVEEPRCQVVRTLDVVGEKWSLLIVRNALRGQTRFSEFRDQLGIPTDILSARLASLVEAGILEKRVYREEGSRERFSYHLTEAGRGLNLVIAALIQWGDEYNPSQWGSASRMVEVGTDQPVTLQFVTADSQFVPLEEVTARPGPASVVAW